MVVNKAWITPETGPISVLKLTDVAVPELGPTEVLVENKYAGLNFIDNYYRGGVYPVKVPFVNGTEAAGEVVKVGSQVKAHVFKVGDRVVYSQLGTYCNYSVVDISKTIVRLPDAMTYEQAAAGFLQGLTAITFITEAYHVNKGDTILVTAAAGGLGLLLTQLIKARGATVIGTVSTQSKAQRFKEAGGDYAIVYKETPDILGEINKITKGKGVNASFDGVGKDTFELSLSAVARKGSLVSIGNASGLVPPFPISRLGEKNIKLTRPRMFGYVATKEELNHYSSLLFKEIESGALKLEIFKVFKFEDYPAAAEVLEQGKSTGKVLLKL